MRMTGALALVLVGIVGVGAAAQSTAGGEPKGEPRSLTGTWVMLLEGHQVGLEVEDKAGTLEATLHIMGQRVLLDGELKDNAFTLTSDAEVGTTDDGLLLTITSRGGFPTEDSPPMPSPPPVPIEFFDRDRMFVPEGPGEGTVKRILPDAHTDFIFAVTAEEFGIVVCMALVLLFAIIVLRALFVAQRAEDPFVRLGVTGLALLFGTQAAINMMVNLHMMPAKGMTLPFISYGGSSLISLALGTGFLLALTRKRPRAESFGEPGRRS